MRLKISIYWILKLYIPTLKPRGRAHRICFKSTTPRLRVLETKQIHFITWNFSNSFLRTFGTIGGYKKLLWPNFHMVGRRKNVPKNVRNKQEELAQFLNTEKMKQNPDQSKINKAQQHLQDTQNYKTTGSIIRSNGKLITEERNRINVSSTKKSKNKSKKQ